MKGLKVLLAIFVFFAVSASPAWAGFKVTSFSCTPDDAFIGMPVSCQVTIDGDSQTSVYLSSVKLSLASPWAGSKTTYSGISFSPRQNISAGGSVVVTFEDIIPTTAGTQGFSEGGLSSNPPMEDYDPSGVTVNVVDPQQHLTGDIFVTEASEGEEFTVSTTLSTQSSLKDVVLFLNITSGSCTLVSNSKKTIPSIITGSQIAVSWKLKQGSDTCQYTINILNASSGTASVFDIGGNEDSGSVSVAGSGSGTGAAAGGGGGGGGGGDDSASEVTVSSVVTGIGALFDFATSEAKDILSDIVLIAKEQAYNVNIKVKALQGKPYPTMPDPVGTAYKYLQISAKNIAPASIEKAEINFKVPLSYLREKDINPASVVLSRNVDNKWKTLPTKKTGSDSANIYFTAETPGFSYFAISVAEGSGYVEEETSVSTETESVDTTPTETEAPVTEALPAKEVVDKLPTVEVPEEEEGTSKVLLVGLVAVIAAAVVVVIKKDDIMSKLK